MKLFSFFLSLGMAAAVAISTGCTQGGGCAGGSCPAPSYSTPAYQSPGPAPSGSSAQGGVPAPPPRFEGSGSR